MSDGDPIGEVPGKGVLTYLPRGRCPSWSPGNQLKCQGYKGHVGLCHAKRLSGGSITWSHRATPEEEDRKEEASEAADLVSDRILQDLVSEDE